MVMQIDVRSRRQLRFVLVGSAVAVLQFLLAYVFIDQGVPAFPAFASAFAAAFLCAYFLHKTWVFRVDGSHVRYMSRYLVTQLTCGLSGSLLAHFLVFWFGAGAMVASGVPTIMSGLLGYLLSSRWVFTD